MLGQEGPKPELGVVLYHLNKSTALVPVIEEVASSHHKSLKVEPTSIHDGGVGMGAHWEGKHW
jgi:hypothetical protein